jgi:hypothetical protein
LNWKATLAVLVIIGIVGLLFATDIGGGYLDFFRRSVGNFASVLFRTTPGETFSIEVLANKQPFYGQSYGVANSTFSARGVYQSINIGGLDVSINSDKKVDVVVHDFNGKFDYTADGSVLIIGDCSSIVIGDRSYSSSKATEVEINLVPFSFSISGISADKISMQSVTGSVKTSRGQASMESSKLDITAFKGNISLSEDEKVKIDGIASSIVGNRFSFI